MKIIIVGAGVIGYSVARQLVQENHDVVVIESNPAVAQYINSRLDCMVITGSGMYLDHLEEAKIEKASFFISLAGSDEVNISCCLMVASQHPHVKKILRTRSIDRGQVAFLERSLGPNTSIINPDQEVANSIVQITKQGAIGDIFNLSIPGLQIRYVQVEESHPIANKSIMEASHLAQVPFLIPLILRKEEIIIPRANEIIQPRDTVYFTALEENFSKIFPLIGKKKKVPTATLR